MSSAAGHMNADLMVRGARIWTGGPQATEAEALAIRSGRILAVGKEADIRPLAGPQTRVVHLDGGALLPGFVDAHIHLLSGGLSLSRVDLRSVHHPDDFRSRVAEAARRAPPESWVLGGGWDEHQWGGERPTRHWLDAVAPGHPVFLTRSDLHMGVANTLALRMAGVPLDEATPSGLGILREDEMDQVTRHVPALTEAQREEAIQAATVEALRHGITQVHDMGVLQNATESWSSLHTLQYLNEQARLGIRVSAAVPLSERHTLRARIQEAGRGCARLQWGSVKSFVDGSLGAGTAWFSEPYANQPGHCGGPVTDLEELAHDLDEAVRLGLDPIVHAIGDAATMWLVRQYQNLLADHGDTVRQLRVEHAQHLRPEMMSALLHPQILLSMQPGHLLDDGPWMAGRLGQHRLSGAYAFRTLLHAGARLALGSDWTVAPMDPRVAIQGATRAQHPGGDQCISVAEALLAHTWGGAQAAGFGTDTGALLPGYRADFTLWDTWPADLSEDQAFTNIQIEQTWVDGVLAWSRT